MLFYQLIPPTTGGREALSFKVVPNGWPGEGANWPATLRAWNKKQFYECWDENLGHRASLLEYAGLGSQRSTGVLKANQKGPRSLLSTQPSLLTLFLSFFQLFCVNKIKTVGLCAWSTPQKANSTFLNVQNLFFLSLLGKPVVKMKKITARFV